MLKSQLFFLATILTLLLASCTPAMATPSPIVTEPAAINSAAVAQSIEIQILESFPVQVHVVVRGQLPDASCTTISSVDQVRDGNTFKITLLTITDPLARCAQALTPFEKVIALDVTNLPAGKYLVDVNGVKQEFELPANNVPSASPTDVQYIMALQDVQIYAGPGENFGVIGQVFSGQVAKVTGTTTDGGWWQVICPDDNTGSCWVSADPILTQPTTAPDVNQPTPSSDAQPTNVQYVMALQDVSIYSGPGMQYSTIGFVASGQVAKVTGISTNGAWWRVICPDNTVGSCWLSANPSDTQPAQAPG